ncbi:YitT family protein [Hylemonella gracilis]|uniref:YitT family protein n=1 Tax=Hylemonella gracilis TaxID=80880 RepID=UPI000688925B|nr:YitT family protein [Hylemonella gracilis]
MKIDPAQSAPESALPSAAPSPVQAVPHTWLEDAIALTTGVLFVALGLVMFKHAGILIGGVAGLAFLASYAFGWNLGLCFFLFSLPFFWLSWRQLGTEFTLKSLGSVAAVSIFTALAPKVLQFDQVNPWLAAVLGGLLIGFGLLALLRHHASVGGVNILAQWAQQKRGYSAGKVQLAVDLPIVLLAFLVVTPERVLQSVLGALALGAFLALNHKPGRYLGV